MGTVAGGLFKQTREAIFALMLSRPDESFHLRDIARRTAAGVGAVQRELAELTRLGILLRESRGRQVYFRANRQLPYFRELQGLVLKTSGAAGVLARMLAPYQPRIAAAAIFGSVARGAASADSDVDLLVLSSDLTVRELGSAVREASQTLSREVNLNLYRPDDWHARVRDGHPLAIAVRDEPIIMLIGDRHELERVG